MNNGFVCPTCGRGYEDEDYCPVDGTQLVQTTPDGPVAAGEPAADRHDPRPEVASPSQDHDSRLAQVMRKMGLRHIGGKSFPRAQPAAPADGDTPLPEVLAEAGWTIAGPLLSGDGVDRWPVEKEAEGDRLRGCFCRYRTGALTSGETYRRLEDKDTPGLVRIQAHGTADFGGARADYDLTIPRDGTALDRWLADTPPSEDRARHLLPPLARLLGKLEEVGVRPLVLEPRNLVQTDDGELCLTVTGALTEVNTSDRYRPEFARSALLPRGWTAPELLDQGMSSANAAVFSVGQLLAAATWGRPCFPGDLKEGAVAFHTIVDPCLTRVLMGCLWSYQSDRWRCEDLVRAADCTTANAMPAAPPWGSLAPGAVSNSFSFAGESFWRLEELLATAVQPTHWQEATGSIAEILAWAEQTAWAGQAKLLRQDLTDGRSADWVLVALARVVRPDAPMTWRELDFSDGAAAASLIGLAQRALNGGDTEAAAVKDLFAADLRGAFTGRSSNSTMSKR